MTTVQSVIVTTTKTVKKQQRKAKNGDKETILRLSNPKAALPIVTTRRQPEPCTEKEAPVVTKPCLFAASSCIKQTNNPKDTTTVISRKTVQFADPSTTKVHHYHYTHNHSETQSQEIVTDASACWYSHAELQALWQDTVQTMRLAKAAETSTGGPFYWTKAVVRIYGACGAPKAAQQSLMRLMDGRFTIPDDCVGLETPRTLAPLYQEFSAHRKTILSKLREIQNQAKVTSPPQDPQEDVAPRIAKVCIQESRAARGYAKYMAEYHHKQQITMENPQE